MASTKASGDRVAWTYTDNNGEAYRVSAKDVYVNDPTDGAKYGGSAAAADLKAKPRGLRMRGVYATDASGNTILVTVYTANAPALTPLTTLTRNFNGVDTEFTTTAMQLAERSGKQAKQQT
jgi:hypothetical protein